MWSEQRKETQGRCLSFVHVDELIVIRTFCDARFWINISPCELNRNTLNARCNFMSPSAPTRWQSRFVDWPNGRSNSSTSMQFSSSAISCRFFVSNFVADTKCLDDWHALFIKCVNVRFSKLFVIIVISINGRTENVQHEKNKNEKRIEQWNNQSNLHTN